MPPSLLSVLCYKFLSMPYKNLWVRFGYDPRSDPVSKVYQAIDYRVPQDVLAMVPESRRGHRGLASCKDTHTHTHMHAHPPHTHMHMHTLTQLCRTMKTPPPRNHSPSLWKQWKKQLSHSILTSFPPSDRSSISCVTSRTLMCRRWWALTTVRRLSSGYGPASGGCGQFIAPLFLQEMCGWCETDTYDRIRKILTTKLRALCTGKRELVVCVV